MCRACLHNEHLATADSNPFSRLFAQPGLATSFENNQLGVGATMVLKHDRCPCDSDGECAAANACAAGIRRHTQEDGSVFNVHVATILFERKNTVRSYSGDGQISKGKFSAGIDAGADGTAFGDIVVEMRRSGRSMRRKQIYIARHLTDTRFFSLRCGERQNRGGTE